MEKKAGSWQRYFVLETSVYGLGPRGSSEAGVQGQRVKVPPVNTQSDYVPEKDSEGKEVCLCVKVKTPPPPPTPGILEERGVSWSQTTE